MGTAVVRRRSRVHLASRDWSLLAFGGLWLVIGSLVAHRAAPPGSQLDFHSFSHVDFRDSVWIAVHDFIHGGVPWDQEAFVRRHPEAQFFPIYLPSYFYLAAPLVLLPYRVSATVWAGLEVAAVLWIAHHSVATWAPGPRRSVPWLPAAVTGGLLVARPVQTAVSQGNFATICAVGAVLALTARPAPLSRHSWRGWLADPAVWGVVVALVKPPVGLAVLFVLVCTRRTALAVWGLGATVALALPIAGVVLHRLGGPEEAFDVLQRAVRAGDGATPGYAHYTRIDVSATVGRLVPHPGPVLLAVVLLATATVAAVALVVADRRFGHLDVRTVTLAGLSIVLLTPNLHYAMIVLVPAMVSLAAHLVADSDGWSIWALSLLVVPVISPVRGGAVLGVTPQVANCVYGLSVLVALPVVVTGVFWGAPSRRVLGRAQPSWMPDRSGYYDRLG